MYQYFIPFHFAEYYIPQFASPVDGHLGLQFWAITNKAVSDIHVRVFGCVYRLDIGFHYSWVNV